MKNRAALLLALFAIGGLAGCGSPADNTAFKAPDGWSSTPGIMGRFKMWMNGSSGNRQILILVRGDQNMNFTDTRQYGTTSNVQDFKHSQIKICGGQQAEYFTGRGQGQNGSSRVEQIVEGIVTPIGDSKYAAIYIRPVDVHADAQAETALRSICPLK